MFIRSVYIDYWERNMEKGKEIYDFDWNLIENAIRNLDGKIKTQVVLDVDGEAHMAIGGGNNQLYNVYTTFDNESFYNLIDPSKSTDEIVQLVTGGQLGDFPARICVSLEEVLKAAKTFVEEGQVDESLEWDVE